jgi:dipeptidyl-peptidase-4
MRIRPHVLLAASLAAAAPAAAPVVAQDAASRLSIQRIFATRDFASAPLPNIHWLKDGASYVDVRPAEGGGSDIVRVALATGAVSVMAPAAALVGADGKRLEIEEITLSADESKALVFHNSVRVWRTNTRGMFSVIDFRTRRVTPIATVTTPAAAASRETDTAAAPFLGKQPSFLARGLQSGAADSTLQMFAKFSPDARQVAFVRGNDLWVADLATGRTRRLTTDGSDDIINGTTDWVYEEELGLRDAFRWSPDGTRIAYWHFDQSAVPAFPMVDETTLYPTVSVLRYPKAGTANSRVKVGVIALADGRTTWLDAGPDTGQYLARMDWAGNDSVVVLRLPRKQNQAELLMLSAASGRGRVMLTDRDSAYVDVEGADEAVRWVNGGRQFLWRTDRTGWRQIFLYDRSGRELRQVTRDGIDVLGIAAVDDQRGDLYVTAAAPTPTQRQVFRFPLAGGVITADGSARVPAPAQRAPGGRVRPGGSANRASANGRSPGGPSAPGQQVTSGAGAHAVTIGPGARFLVDFFTTASQPVVATLYELPGMRRRRVLTDNAALTRRLAALTIRAPEFFRIPMPDGIQLDAYRIVPADFDSTRKYPVLMYVYGGPASPTVSDQWGGSRYLWHQLLAQQGYVVVSVDNRGAAWRGRDFRKITQYRLGARESEDQLDAAKWLGRQRWVDAARIGMWGWSYGGYMTTLTAFKGGNVFKAAIAVAPVTDWGLYDTIYTERFMWTPQDNAEGYRTSAPQAHVAGLTARLLLVHGTGDDNVHPQNTIQLVNKLQAVGKPFQLMLYPNRTHSISGGNTQAHLFEMMTRFVKENL